jgi:hypothetical protein
MCNLEVRALSKWDLREIFCCRSGMCGSYCLAGF